MSVVPVQVGWHILEGKWLSESDTRDLAEVKRDLEERIEKAEREIHNLRIALKVIDEALTKVSFKPASKLVVQQTGAPAPQTEPAAVVAQNAAAQPAAPAASPAYSAPRASEKACPPPSAGPAAPRAQLGPRPQSEAPEIAEQAFPIKSKNGEDLGTLYIGQYSVRIVPHASLKLSAKTPPFQSFFVDRVIGEMRRKDEMAVDAGSKDPMSIIDHEILQEGDIIKEIRISNIDADARVRELRSSIRWTFERMMDKRTA